MGLFDKLNKVAGDIASGISDIASPSEASEEGKSIHDLFTPFGVPSFAFKENSVLYGKDEYSYTDIKKIKLNNLPASNLTNGVITVTLKNGKFKLLSFNVVHTKRILKAFKYATERLAEVNNLPNEYQFILLANNGSRLEVYEQYAYLHQLPQNITQKEKHTILEYQDLVIQTEALSFDNDNMNVIVSYQGERITLEISKDDMSIVQDIINYIQTVKESSNLQMQSPASSKDTWQAKQGVAKRFPLCGQTLEVTEGLDLFNTYRKQFMILGNECYGYAEKEYREKVKDLRTFLMYFNSIHNYYCNIICDKAMEIVVAEGIWTVTRDSFYNEYSSICCNSAQIVKAVYDVIQGARQKNTEMVSNLMGMVPHLQGGGFGVKGAAKGIAIASAFNVARDVIEAGVTMSCDSLNDDEQDAIYEQIKIQVQPVLLNAMHDDYCNAYLVLGKILKKNNKNIWILNEKKMTEGENIFQNLTNPNFPQDKAVEIIISLILSNPYNPEYHKYLKNKFGDSEEVSAITNYFGFTDL